MAAHDMFLAMILANAHREEARGVMLAVEDAKSQIHMLLLDGSTQPLTAPPAEVMVKIIESLEQGQTEYRSAVFVAEIEQVDVQRSPTGMSASISTWTITHT